MKTTSRKIIRGLIRATLGIALLGFGACAAPTDVASSDGLGQSIDATKLGLAPGASRAALADRPGTVDLATKPGGERIVKPGDRSSALDGTGTICDPKKPCLTSGGGPVLENLKIVNIFMSSDWDSDNSGLNITRQSINDFTQKLVSSSYFSAAMSDYGVKSTSFGGSFDATGLSRGLCPTPSVEGLSEATLIDAWIACMASAGPLPITSSGLGLNATIGNLPPPDDDTLYVIYLPKGTHIVEASVKSFGGYHFWHDVPKWSWDCGLDCHGCLADFCSPLCCVCTPHCGPALHTQRFAYAVVPAESANGQLNELTVNASHEIIEAAVDPILPTGWIDRTSALLYVNEQILLSGEVGDICEPSEGAVPTQPVTMSDGNRVAPYWSVSASACTPRTPVVHGFGAVPQDYVGLDFGLPSPWQSIAGDFNGDGKGDYARLGDTGAWVFFSNGDSTFEQRFQSYVDEAPILNFGAPSPWTPIVGDFNGDGKGDYARLGDTGAWVFYGNSDKTFTRSFQSYVDEAPALNFGVPSPWTSIAGDFNGDGKTDYARLGDTGARVFFGNANNTFTRGFQSYVDEAPALNFGAPSPWTSIAGDFNGDGKTDYARLGDTGAWVFFGNANGTFTRGFQSYADEAPALNFGAPSSWTSIVGDFNGDRRTDYARLGDTGAWVFFGNANGTFARGFQSYVDEAPALNFGAPSPWTSIAGDFDGDGRTDYARLGDTGAWVFFGNTDGTFNRGFQSYEGLTFGMPSPWQVVTGGFKGDGKTGYARLGGPRAYVFVYR